MTYATERAKLGREPVLVMELDLDYCPLTYGTAPCVAALGVTGQHKCFNTRRTCQDPAHYEVGTKTYRFSDKELRVPHAPLTVTMDVDAVMPPPSGDVGATIANAYGFIDYEWSKVSGPGVATFADGDALNTSVSFSLPGVYVLRLTVADDKGTATGEATVTAPAMDFVLDVAAEMPLLEGDVSAVVSNPYGAVTYAWSQVSGPGVASFDDAAALSTHVSFDIPGTYVLRLTVTDNAGPIAHDASVEAATSTELVVAFSAVEEPEPQAIQTVVAV